MSRPAPGRPPAEPLELDRADIERLVAESIELSRDKVKLKAWLAPKRIFHVLLQDHLSTAPIPGGKGVLQNAASSKLFLEMTEPLAAALEGVEDEGEEVSDDTSEVRVVKPPQRKGGRVRRKPTR